MLYITIRMLHLLAALILCMAILITNLGVSRTLSAEDRRSLRGMLAVQAAAIVVMAITGMTIWLVLGRPAEFYNGNPVFHIKLLLFAALVLLTIPAALHLKAAGCSAEDESSPGHVLVALRLQLVVFIAIPLLAWLVARGIGH
ncbi:MAG: DUF2214 family protein [Pseudohongiellaceae bacterium]